MSRAYTWTARGLREEITRIRSTVEDQNLATAEEIADYAVGGSENPHEGFGALVYCYAQYSAFLRRMERRDEISHSEDFGRAALDALRTSPREVVLESTGGPSQSVFVHPKSLDALLLIADLDSYLGELGTALHRANQASPETRALVTSKIFEEISYQHRLCVAIVCHAGPESPFETLALKRPEPPIWTRSLSPFDIIRILSAHHYVNGKRVSAVLQLLRPGAAVPDRSPRLSWATLVSELAERRRIPAPHLMKHQDLPSLLAQAGLSAAADQERAARSQDAGLRKLLDEDN